MPLLPFALSKQPQKNELKAPCHVAIIMDGNGRWANARGWRRTTGHKHGIDAVKRAVKIVADRGAEYLTLFGFSTENWGRPEDEVNELMGLLRMYLRSETADLHKHGIVLKVIGDRSRFAPDIVEMIEKAEALTANNSGLKLVIALNYGGRQDIAQAAYKIAIEAAASGNVPTPAEMEKMLEQNLYTAQIPDPDLLIRTSGEQRISNFLIWSSAYTEFVFLDTLWPDFDDAAFDEALRQYHGRERRFGGVLCRNEDVTL